METNEIVLSGVQLKKLMEHMELPIMEKYQLRQVELDILVFLYLSRGNTAKEIMKKKCISKAHVSKSIDNLYSKGYVRLMEDTKDHRVIHIGLTEAAIQIAQETIQIHEVCRSILLKDISEEEFELVKKVTKKMLENIKKALESISDDKKNVSVQ